MTVQLLTSKCGLTHHEYNLYVNISGIFFFLFISIVSLFHKINHGTTAAHCATIHHFFPFTKSWNTTFPKHCPSEELQVKLDCDCSRLLHEGSVSHAFVSFHVSFLMTEGELYFIPQQWHSSWKGFEPLLIDLRDMGDDLTHKIQLISTPVLPLSLSKRVSATAAAL